MLIPAKKSFSEEIKHKKDKTIITHYQLTEHIKQNVRKISKNGDGWSQDREYKHIARIPAILFLKISHIIAPNGRIDEKLFAKWLNTDEGREYKVSNL